MTLDPTTILGLSVFAFLAIVYAIYAAVSEEAASWVLFAGMFGTPVVLGVIAVAR